MKFKISGGPKQEQTMTRAEYNKVIAMAKAVARERSRGDDAYGSETYTISEIVIAEAAHFSAAWNVPEDLVVSSCKGKSDKDLGPMLLETIKQRGGGDFKAENCEAWMEAKQQVHFIEGTGFACFSNLRDISKMFPAYSKTIVFTFKSLMIELPISRVKKEIKNLPKDCMWLVKITEPQVKLDIRKPLPICESCRVMLATRKLTILRIWKAYWVATWKDGKGGLNLPLDVYPKSQFHKNSTDKGACIYLDLDLFINLPKARFNRMQPVLQQENEMATKKVITKGTTLQGETVDIEHPKEIEALEGDSDMELLYRCHEMLEKLQLNLSLFGPKEKRQAEVVLYTRGKPSKKIAAAKGETTVKAFAKALELAQESF